jgi:hypothetical protein
MLESRSCATPRGKQSALDFSRLIPGIVIARAQIFGNTLGYVSLHHC